MGIVHQLTRFRCKIIQQAGLEISDKILERIISLFYKIPHFKTGILHKVEERPVIISLTTIPSRVDKVWLTTESLLRQSRKPDKVLLWLAENEFEKIKIPEILKKQQKRGLEIRYCKNIKSYKKFYYTMLENPNTYVLTVDDDHIYSEKLVEEMIGVSVRYPCNIVCNRSHKIRIDKNGILPYYRWIYYEKRKKMEETPSFQNFFTGNGGVLFPVWVLDKEIFREDIFMRVAPTADDAWLNFIAWKSRIKVINTTGVLGHAIPIQESSSVGLFKKNIIKD